MKKLRVLKVVFELELDRWKIPLFRGAINHEVKNRSVLFHNHLDKGFRYAYPLIQYKVIKNNAAIICVDEGADEIHHFFENTTWKLNIGEEQVATSVLQLNMNQFNMQVWDKFFHYRVNNWIALDQESFNQYKEMEGLIEKVKFLESKLIGNILSMAKGIEWRVESTIILNILNEPSQHFVKVKGVRLMSFNCEFKSNVFLPNYIGLGNKVSLGYGVVTQVKSKRD